MWHSSGKPQENYIAEGPAKQSLVAHTSNPCHFDRAWRTRAYAGPHDGAQRRSGNVRVSSDGEICPAALPETAGRATLPVDSSPNLPSFWRRQNLSRPPKAPSNYPASAHCRYQRTSASWEALGASTATDRPGTCAPLAQTYLTHMLFFASITALAVPWLVSIGVPQGELRSLLWRVSSVECNFSVMQWPKQRILVDYATKQPDVMKTRFARDPAPSLRMLLKLRLWHDGKSWNRSAARNFFTEFTNFGFSSFLGCRHLPWVQH